MNPRSVATIVPGFKISKNTLIVFTVTFINVALPLTVAGIITRNALLPVIPVAALLLLFIVLIEPAIGVIVLVVLLPFNGLISQLLGDGIASTGFGALKDLILLMLLVGAARKRRWRGLRIEIVVIVGIIIVFSLISALWASGWVSGAYGWRNDFEPLLLLLCVPVLINKDSIKRISSVMAVVGQVGALMSIVTWAIGLTWLRAIGRLPVAPGEAFPSSLFTAGSIQPRAFSPYVAPNEMAVAVVIIVAVIWSRGDWKLRTRILLTILPTAAVILSSSRSGLLGLALVFAALVVRWLFTIRRPRMAIGFLVLGTALGVGVVSLYWVQQLMTSVDPSLLGHATSIDQALSLIASNPTGIGLGNVGPRAIRFVDSPYTVESFWLLLAIESGVIVLLAFIALLVRVCYIGIRANTSMAFLAATAVFGSLVSQLVLPTLQEGAVSFTLWIAVSLGLASARLAQRDSVARAEVSDDVPATARS